VALRLALDTNRYVDLARGDDAGLRNLIDHAQEVWLPYVVVGELRGGFAIGTQGKQNERELQRFLRKPGVDVVYPTDTTTRFYASIYAQLRAQGTPVPTNDMWIAALVVEHDLVLCTRDAHFKYLPQIELA